MALAVRSPFSDLFEFSRELDQLFNAPRLSAAGDAPRSWVPPVDIELDDNEIRIAADLPGVNKDDIDVTVDGNQLTIRARREAETKEEKEGGYVRRERSFGEYVRSFSLPDFADIEKLEAHYEDGVLKLTIPKRAEAKPRQVKVK